MVIEERVACDFGVWKEGQMWRCCMWINEWLLGSYLWIWINPKTL